MVLAYSAACEDFVPLLSRPAVPIQDGCRHVLIYVGVRMAVSTHTFCLWNRLNLLKYSSSTALANLDAKH